MENHKIYKLYNQIIKEFDVMVMNKFEIQQLHNDEKFLVLKSKHVVDTKHRSKRKSKQPTLRQLIMDMRKDLDNLRTDVNDLRTDLNNIVKLNNLRTE